VPRGQLRARLARMWGPEGIWCLRPLDSFNQDVSGVARQSSQALAIAPQNRSAWLGHGDDQGIDGRPSVSHPAQMSCPPCARLQKYDLDVTCLEELISSGIMIRPAGEALDQDHAGTAGGQRPGASGRRSPPKPIAIALQGSSRLRCLERPMCSQLACRAWWSAIRRAMASARATSSGVGSPTSLVKSSR
jgi:hypothetical protein